MRIAVTDIAKLVHGEIVGDGNVFVSGFSGIQEAKEGDLTFLVNPKYEPLLTSSKATVIIIPRSMSCPGKTVIRVDNPSVAFTQAINLMLKDTPKYHPSGIHASAVISPQAKLGRNVSVGPLAVIEAGAVVGEGTIIHAGCYVGHQVSIGKDCLLYPHVSLREHVSIGDRAIIHNGAVIGSDGYGFVPANGMHMKIPQVGTVIVQDDVEIGANVTIDRARFDKTVIGEGTKIDNLVHIAHNVIVGKHCLIVAQVGVSGSTVIGNNVILAGQAGIIGHLKIGDGAIVAAQAGVIRDILPGEQVFGSPCLPIKESLKASVHIKKLDEYVQTIKELKKRIEELEKKMS